MSRAVEEWRVIPGTNGLYEASDHGRIRSWNKPGNPLQVKERRRSTPLVLSPRISKVDGRPGVQIRMDGRLRSPHVQVLVAAAFLGPRPPGMSVCHNDGNPANNHVGNLRYDTPKGNSADMVAHGTRRQGALVGNTPLTDELVVSIREEYAQGDVYLHELAERYGTTSSSMGAIVRGKTWKHAGGPRTQRCRPYLRGNRPRPVGTPDVDTTSSGAA